MGALTDWKPALYMDWNPKTEDSDMQYSIKGSIRKRLKNKLMDVILERVTDMEKTNFSVYYKAGKLFDKGGKLCSSSFEKRSLNFDDDTYTESFEGSDDYEAIDGCGSFSQSMAEIMFVLDHFIGYDGRLLESDFYSDPLSTLKDEVVFSGFYDFLSSSEDYCDYYDSEDDLMDECLDLVKGFDLAFSGKSGPLPCTVHTFFLDIIKNFENTLSEYNLRKCFLPFFSLFYGNMDSYDACVNVISSCKVGKYKRVRDKIPDTDPVKSLVDQAVSIFETPINNEDVITQVYDVDPERTTVVFITGCSEGEYWTVDMIHPFYDDIVKAMHKDIDFLLEKYHL